MTHEEIMKNLELDHQEKMAQINKKAEEADAIISKINSEINDANTIEKLPTPEALASAFKQIMTIMK